MNRFMPLFSILMCSICVLVACSEDITEPPEASVERIDNGPVGSSFDDPVQIASKTDFVALYPEEPTPRRVFVSPQVGTMLFFDLERLEPLLTLAGDTPDEGAPWFRSDVYLSLHTDVQRPYMDVRLKPIEVRFYERSLGECTARLFLRWDEMDAPIEGMMPIDTRILRVMANPLADPNVHEKHTLFATITQANPMPQQWGDAQACEAFVAQMVGRAVEVNLNIKADSVAGYVATHRRFTRAVRGGLQVTPPFLMLPGATAQIQVAPVGQTGQRLWAGSNWDGYDPFTLLAPASLVETMVFDQHFGLTVKAGQSRGDWQVEPPVGASFGGEVIGPEALTSWRTEMCASPSEDWQTCASFGGYGLQVPYGTMVCAHADILYRGRQPLVAGRLPVVAESQTPEVCPVVDLGTDDARPVVCVHALAPGQCRFSLSASGAPQLFAQHHQFGVLGL